MLNRDLFKHFLAGLLLALQLGLLPAIAFSGISGEATLLALHRDVSEILHGDPMTVIPTLALCFPNERPPNKYTHDAEQWYLEKSGPCKAIYTPNIHSLFSPLSELGAIRHFFYDDRKYNNLIKSLRDLSLLNEIQDLSVLRKIELQTTLWELIFALEFKRNIKTEDPKISQDKIDNILIYAHRALKEVLMGEEEIKKIPNTLLDLPSLSKAPAISDLVQKLYKHDESIVEDLYPWQFHAQASIGRFHGRIFITSDDKQGLSQLLDYLRLRKNTKLLGFSWLKDKAMMKPIPEFGATEDIDHLQSRFGGIRIVLILYFNVIDKEYHIRPTPLIAGWREVWYEKQTEPNMSLAEIDKLFGFRAIEYQKQFDITEPDPSADENKKLEPAYRLVPEAGISRVTFLNVNPVYPDTKVTTTRGNCLSCHAYRTRTYWVHKRAVGFSPPLFKQPEEVVKPIYKENAEPMLKRWAEHYLDLKLHENLE